jgi:hypothetical protein
MNVDLEFFRIVEELGPLGSFESHPSTSKRMPEAKSCGCQTLEGSACCSTPSRNPVESAWSKVTFAPSAGGPKDQTITPYPKWDPVTRTWWKWDESISGWVRPA